MRLTSLILLAMLWAVPVAAQGWSAQVSRDSAYDGGWVSMPGYALGFSCAARSPQNGSVIDSTWFETSIAPPWHFLVGISERLIPMGNHARRDIILFVDQTGYRLPPVMPNEMEGGWQLELAMTDPIFKALEGASRLVLQTGPQAAWELPTANLGPALTEVRNVCAATWQATGHGARPGLGQGAAAPANRVAAPTLDLRRIAENFAASNCSDFFTFGPNALRTANIDGDGIPDVILDYNDITCDNNARRPAVCGASLCSVDVFLSATFPITGQPENLLGMSAGLVPLSNGNNAVSTSGNLSMCQSTNGCDVLWYWNGAAFTELPR